MNEEQREVAERLIAEHPTLFMNDLPDWCDDAFHLLRELAAERERIAAWLDAEHEKRKHLDNHAAFYAAAIRAQETP